MNQQFDLVIIVGGYVDGAALLRAEALL